ncbi:MAG: endolytic transglycosylase MltG [Anaerolineales bacterium]|nr:endolytic transglycosylase MltG [Anaerolineales bacterium]MCB8953258.1 endolytic transglycosylase MltG [Ardenticatenales bacterium]
MTTNHSPTPQHRDPYAPPPGGHVIHRLARLLLFFVGLAACLTASLVFYASWRQSQYTGQVRVSPGNSQLNPAEYFYLQTYLGLHAAELAQPAGARPAAGDFTIAPGETANVIAANLVAQGFLTNADLFVNYVRYYGLDAGLEAGQYTIAPGATVPELANALSDSVGQEVTVRFLEGWRSEEMANYLAQTTPARVDAAQFQAIVRRLVPYDLARYDFLDPTAGSLEGFLFPDTYRLPLDADAAYLVDLMLQNFGRRVTPEMRQAYLSNGLSPRQAVTLAAIVEREAVVDAERPLVASVFFNRLAQGMKLDADPTVQYAVGQAADGSWWKSPLGVADLALDSPYNTYLYTGLPPGPIANPGLASLQAVAQPAQTNYLFFVADCDANAAGLHLFSATYEEHLANVATCR